MNLLVYGASLAHGLSFSRSSCLRAWWSRSSTLMLLACCCAWSQSSAAGTDRVEPMPADASTAAQPLGSPDWSAQQLLFSEMVQGDGLVAKAGAGTAVQMTAPASYSLNAAQSRVHLELAKITNTSPTMTSGSLRLELWASRLAYSGGSLNGYRLASLPLRAKGSLSPTPLAPGASFQNISQDVSVETLPPPGTYYPVLMVTEYSSSCAVNGGYCMDDYLSLSPQLEVSSGSSAGDSIELRGSYANAPDYTARTVSFALAELANTSATRTTGTLRLEFWLTTAAYSGGNISGYRLSVAPLAGLSNTNGDGTLTPGSSFKNISTNGSLASQPPGGTYYGTLIVSEYNQSCGTSDGYCIVDWAAYDSQYVVPPSAVPGTSGDINTGNGGAMDLPLLALLGLAGLLSGLRRRGTAAH